MYAYDTAAIDRIAADLRAQGFDLFARWIESCRTYGTLEELHAALPHGFAQIDEAGYAVIEERLREVRAGTAKFVTHEEVEAELDRIDREIGGKE